MSGTEDHEKSLLNTFGNGRHSLDQSEVRTTAPLLAGGPKSCNSGLAMALQGDIRVRCALGGYPQAGGGSRMSKAFFSRLARPFGNEAPRVTSTDVRERQRCNSLTWYELCGRTGVPKAARPNVSFAVAE